MADVRFLNIAIVDLRLSGNELYMAETSHMANLPHLGRTWTISCQISAHVDFEKEDLRPCFRLLKRAVRAKPLFRTQVLITIYGHFAVLALAVMMLPAWLKLPPSARSRSHSRNQSREW